MYILVVHTEPKVRAALTQLLRTLRHDVREAKSGSEALAILKGNEPLDALVADLEMTDMDGLELLRQFKALMIRPNLRFLLVSSGPDDAAFNDVLQAEGLGAEFVRKPWRPSAFHKALSADWVGEF